MPTSYEYERKTENELKDILGWADGSNSDLTTEILCVVMALCEKVKELRCEIEKLKQSNEEVRLR